jgi:hypothetical protein
MGYQSHLKLFIVIELLILNISSWTLMIIFFKTKHPLLLQLISFLREVFLS